MYNSIIDKLCDKDICILGFGKEGKSTYNFIRRHLKDKFITILDKKDVSSDKLVINDNNVKIVSGKNYLENLEEYDLIIKSPGVKLENVDVSKIKNKLTSQLELILPVFKKNIIGITGTKGKSTTSSLINKILLDQGFKTYLIGNIGNSILDYVEEFDFNTYLVIEMSALQLEFVDTSPHIGIVLNLYEDHLDYFNTLDNYHSSKMNMFKYQDNNDYGIYSLDNKNTIDQITKNSYLSSLYKVTLNNKKDLNTIYLDNDKVILNDEEMYDKNNKSNLLGEHNLSNIMFCLVVSKILNLDFNKVNKSIENFLPLEHRMELVGTYNGVIYYNDSISTIPMATINAIESLKDVNTLIFGGMDRGIQYTELVDYLDKCNVENLICMPTTGYKIGALIQKNNSSKNIYYIEYLEDAVKKAKEVTKKGKICLMSPAASSYEYFKNFEEKGKKFKEFVKND